MSIGGCVSPKTLVLGIGNLHLSDKGVGMHVARALRRDDIPRVAVLDIGTPFLDALPEIADADRIIVIDAMQRGKAPGAVYRCTHPGSYASLHADDLSRVFSLAGRDTVPEVTVIGIEPARIDWGTGLSLQVASMLPRALDAVRREIALPAPYPVDVISMHDEPFPSPTHTCT